MKGNILAIETSCDETAAAVLKDGKELLSNVVSSQIDIHKVFGGVVPEIAARKHTEQIRLIVDQAVKGSAVGYGDIDAIAVTYGPGLVGALLVGLNYAKGLSISLNRPLITVNHLMGHIYANFLAIDGLKPPFIILLVSGGHTMLIKALDYIQFEIIGQSVDDSAGEAFDKVARIMGLDYPGGPVIDKLAGKGEEKFSFPRPMYDNGYDFSFSGLKTAVLYFIKDNSGYRKEDICASFQKSIIETLVHKTIKCAEDSKIRKILIAGGVAANSKLRGEMDKYKNRFDIFYPPMGLCTDNAAMIARAGYEKYKRGLFSDLAVDVIPNLGIDKL